MRVQLRSYEKEFRITATLTFSLPPRALWRAARWVATGPGEAELAQGLQEACPAAPPLTAGLPHPPPALRSRRRQPKEEEGAGRPFVPLAGSVSEGRKTMGSDVFWIFIDLT